MSNWSHVAGIIRIDDIRFDDKTPDFDKLVGKEMSYHEYSFTNPEDIDKSKYLPMGTQGSLQKSVWINPNINHINAYTISIFGDLRDHDSTSEIIQWFKDKCKSISEDYRIRQAVITVENEWSGTESWTCTQK